MDISISKTREEIVVKIIGAISDSEGNNLTKVFDDVLNSPHKNVILNLSLVPAITSTGIGKIIVFYRKLKEMERTLKIKGIHVNLYTMFTSINLDKMLTIIR